jgi:Tc5 transposase DNA-binding domain
MKSRKDLERHVTSHLNALSSKRPCVVTRPDVERALVLWMRHMEEKGESVTGPMLKVKQLKFEKEFNVPEEERLSADGWIVPFCKAYGYKERR